jgi:hypothetical protein
MGDMRLKRIISEMEIIPRGYGVAWVCEHRTQAVCLPLGLHWLAGAVRAVYLWCRVAMVPTVVDGIVARSYDRGFAAGRLVGKRDAEIDLKQELLTRRQEIEQDAIHRFIEQSIAELDSRREYH